MRVAHLLGRELNAVARLEAAVAALHGEQAPGWDGYTLVALEEGDLRGWRAAEGPDVLVVDLDRVGRSGLDDLRGVVALDGGPERVIGYFSHVDSDLGEAARGAGIEVYPRSRFWRELKPILRGT